MKMKKALAALVCLILVLSMTSMMALAAVSPDPGDDAPDVPTVPAARDYRSDSRGYVASDTVYDLSGPKEIDPSQNVTFTSPTPFDQFKGVEMDGEPVDEENYTAESGSTIVTFSSKYLSTLSKGEHTVKLLFRDGFARMTFTSKSIPAEKSPDTGLQLSGDLFAATLVLATVCGGAVAVSTKKKG